MPSDVSLAGAHQDHEPTIRELKGELAEAREQQAATAEILKVISSSPMDLRRVFAVIAMSAARLCDAHDAAIHQVDGKALRLVAHYGPILAPESLPLMRGVLAARAVLDQETIHIADLQSEADQFPEGSEFARRHGHRTIVCVPLMRAGDAIGAISIRRVEVRPFTDRQIDLLKTFADQAVIAIENTRLFEAEQTRTRELTERTQELTESLEYQTAISEVLAVISRSPSDLQPVLQAIVETAARLCQADKANIRRKEAGSYRTVASVGFTQAQRDFIEQTVIQLDRTTMGGRVALDQETVHIADVLEDRDLRMDILSGINFRTGLGVPLLRKGELIGLLLLSREKQQSFSTRQIALVETFADQAVIAIENTRLFEAEQVRTKELTQSLEYQTAMADVLGIISRSPSNLQPVLDAIAARAKRLCAASDAVIERLEGDRFYNAAHSGTQMKGLVGLPLPLTRQFPGGRAVLDRKAVIIDDIGLVAESEYPDTLDLLKLNTIHSVAEVPLLSEGRPLGSLAILRAEVRPFTNKEVAMLESFASQAVIAIENARLFEAEQASKRELTEALEQQTATADVLKVISRSALDLQKVLDALVESAARLCDAYDAAVYQVDGSSLRLVAHHGNIPFPAPIGEHKRPLVRGFIACRAVIERRTNHIADMQAEAEDYAEGREVALQLGWRTGLGVPLLRAGDAIGVILLRRREVRPFTRKQIELLKTFADQAVIAIENTRLFEEVQARTRELAKTVDDLEIASQHKNQFVANMSHELRTPLAAILGYAELIQEGFYEPQGPKSLDALTRIRSNGKHLLGLINTVLDIAKIESGQFTLNMSEYAIESVVETVRSATESLAQNKKLALTTEVAKSLPIGLGDEQRLTQVLLNLVGNAIKFTDTGEVRVTAKAVTGHFNVSVTDTGPGIPEEHQARIFEQFHQVDSSNTKAKGGTGLGLAIAKQIVEMHGGRIWVESTVGRGSTFQMELPTSAEFTKRAP